MAFTDCDSNNALSELSKKMGINDLLGSKEYQRSRGKFGEEPELSNSLSEAGETIICAVCSKGVSMSYLAARSFREVWESLEKNPSSATAFQRHVKPSYVQST